MDALPQNGLEKKYILLGFAPISPDYWSNVTGFQSPIVSVYTYLQTKPWADRADYDRASCLVGWCGCFRDVLKRLPLYLHLFCSYWFAALWWIYFPLTCLSAIEFLNLTKGSGIWRKVQMLPTKLTTARKLRIYYQISSSVKGELCSTLRGLMIDMLKIISRFC